jgi:hypothetical protein
VRLGRREMARPVRFFFCTMGSFVGANLFQLIDIVQHGLQFTVDKYFEKLAVEGNCPLRELNWNNYK